MSRLVILTVCILAGTYARAHDLRAELQAAAAVQDTDFPDGVNQILTHFSIVCTLEKSSIYVVDQRSVLAGMLAPRGVNKIAFYDKKQKLVGSVGYIASRPLWCEGEDLFLAGAWDAAMPGDRRCPASNCNAIGWEAQSRSFRLKYMKKYGSSGGLED